MALHSYAKSTTFWRRSCSTCPAITHSLPCWIRGWVFYTSYWCHVYDFLLMIFIKNIPQLIPIHLFSIRRNADKSADRVSIYCFQKNQVNSCSDFFVVTPSWTLSQLSVDEYYIKWPHLGPGPPLFPLFLHFPIFFYFSLFSVALTIFFFCPSLSFLPEQSHSISRLEVIGSDQTWV